MKHPVYITCNMILDFFQNSSKIKARHALNYWKIQKAKEGILQNDHYEYFYTNHFDLNRTFYKGKKILDIGCGARGSLEWADTSAERVGLDPLAYEYSKLGANNHKMRYVSAYSENIPFADEYFDVVVSFNSLDHVNNLDQTIKEIKRVLAPEGIFLLITELHEVRTIREPMVFSWDIIEKLTPELKVLDEKHYEKDINGIYESIRSAIPYDHANTLQRYGILSAKFIKSVNGKV